MNKIIRVALVRLCECDGTVANLWGRQNDLTEQGLRQARATHLRVSGLKIKCWFTSSSTACQQTADILADGKPVSVSSEFSHPPYPKWNGLTLDEVKKQWPNEYRGFWNPQPGDAQRVIVPGGESFQATIDRLKLGLEQIYKDCSKGEAVGIVTHGEVIRLFIMSLLGAPLENFSRLRGRNGAITLFDFDGKAALFECINDTAHLGIPSQDFGEIALKI